MKDLLALLGQVFAVIGWLSVLAGAGIIAANIGPRDMKDVLIGLVFLVVGLVLAWTLRRSFRHDF